MGPKVQRLRQFLQDCWDGRKEAAGVWESTYRHKPPELDGEVSMLDEALAEEFERGYKARMEDEKIPEPGAWVHGDGGL